MLDVTGVQGALVLLSSDWLSWAVVPIGIMIGLIAGAIPGISGTMALAIVLPTVLWMDFLPAMMLLTSVFTGAGFGGAIPAILMGVPGTTSSVATTFDGYPMAKKGLHNQALGLALMTSTVACAASYVVLFFMIEPIAWAVVKLGPAEMVVVIAWGLTMIATLQGDNISKGLFAGMVGILLGTVGMSLKGYLRGTMGIPQLLDGIPAVPALLGILAGSELLNLLGTNFLIADESRRKADFRKVLQGMRQTFSHKVVLIRGSMAGAFIGIMPGVGASIANLVSYAEARRTSKDPESFGKGNPEGVVAAESANSSSEGGDMTTLLALGLPSGGGTAVLLAAFGLHGITGGPSFIRDHKDIVYAIIINNIVQCLVLIVLGALFLRVAGQVVRVPIRFLIPTVFVIAILCVYSLVGDISGPITFLIGAGVGWVMRQYGYSVAAVVIGLLLGRMFEAEMIRVYQISGGQLDYFLGRPVALGLTVFILFSLFYSPLKKLFGKRPESRST
jgi:putative tricarboxylic transport membrane protein